MQPLFYFRIHQLQHVSQNEVYAEAVPCSDSGKGSTGVPSKYCTPGTYSEPVASNDQRMAMYANSQDNPNASHQEDPLYMNSDSDVQEPTGTGDQSRVLILTIYVYVRKHLQLWMDLKAVVSLLDQYQVC